MHNNTSKDVQGTPRRRAEEDRQATFRASLDRAREQIAQGRGIVWTDETMDEILREADEADERREPIRAEIRP